MKGKIVEVFESIQGEGIYLGERQLFVRFFGCNLDCKFCDTRLIRFKEYAPEDLIKELKTYKGEFHSISFTGGEPLLQVSFLKEILKLAKRGNFLNYLETNGTLPEALEEVINYLDFIAMDLKLASSTGIINFWASHRKFLEIASRKEVFLKIVVCQSTGVEDLLEALHLIKEMNKAIVLVLQPNTQENDIYLQKKIEGFRDMCIKENITTCIIPQVHRRLGVR
ncbi:MAG: 7-carboxy-7-deazaguanine synthase QueE [Candidatus Omnitrophota bacterium]